MTHESDVLSSDTALRAKLLIKFEEETKQAEEVRIMKFLNMHFRTQHHGSK